MTLRERMFLVGAAAWTVLTTGALLGLQILQIAGCK